eukprot:1687523-Amphidinium_carterae.1
MSLCRHFMTNWNRSSVGCLPTLTKTQLECAYGAMTPQMVNPRQNLNTEVYDVCLELYHASCILPFQSLTPSQKRLGQEIIGKVAEWDGMPNDIKWHFIGTLQSNK